MIRRKRNNATKGKRLEAGAGQMATTKTQCGVDLLELGLTTADAAEICQEDGSNGTYVVRVISYIADVQLANDNHG